MAAAGLGARQRGRGDRARRRGQRDVLEVGARLAVTSRRRVVELLGQRSQPVAVAHHRGVSRSSPAAVRRGAARAAPAARAAIVATRPGSPRRARRPPCRPGRRRPDPRAGCWTPAGSRRACRCARPRPRRTGPRVRCARDTSVTHAAAAVVRARHHRDRLARRVDARCHGTPRSRSGTAGAKPVDAAGVEVDTRIPGRGQSRVDRRGDHVARRQVTHRVHARGDRIALRINQYRALAAHAPR